MKARGFILYPGKLTVVDSFRMGHIGRLDAGVMRQVVEAARATLQDMGVASAAPPEAAQAEKRRAEREMA
jgi:2-aminoethylphosphonate-pyruvate transaminase